MSDPTPSYLKAAVHTGEIRFPNEPSRLLPTDLERLFMWAVEQGTSDITIQSNKPVFLEIYGKKHWATRRAITHNEVMGLISAMFRSDSAKADLAGPRALDFAYELRPERGVRLRFRINATAVNAEGALGVQITARHISSLPPRLLDMGIEPEILANMAPKQGLVLVTGGTGSGKSTLLAAIIRYLAENPNANLKILTYEQPIEFVYDEVETPTTSIAQTEIGRNLLTFEEGTRNALRRKPDIILVGEARDKETIGEAITASMTGHLLFSTIHSNGVADTMRRMVNVFPAEEKNARAVDIVSAVRLIISQRLVPSTDGKRVALREFLVFNEEIVDEILDAGPDNMTTVCRRVLRKHGRSFLQDAEQKFREGRISERTLKEIAQGARGEGRDAKAQQAALLNSLARQEEAAHQATHQAMSVLDEEDQQERALLEKLLGQPEAPRPASRAPLGAVPAEPVGAVDWNLLGTAASVDVDPTKES